MPILNIQLSAPRSPDLSRHITQLLLDLTTRLLGKDPALTAIVLTHIPPGDWSIGGTTLAEHGLHSAYVDIKVTDETNTRAEKAQYIAEVFAGLQALLGPLHSHSYVHVHEVRATAYGYGGLTQGQRLAMGQPAIRTP